MARPSPPATGYHARPAAINHGRNGVLSRPVVGRRVDTARRNVVERGVRIGAVRFPRRRVLTRLRTTKDRGMDGWFGFEREWLATLVEAMIPGDPELGRPGVAGAENATFAAQL